MSELLREYGPISLSKFERSLEWSIQRTLVYWGVNCCVQVDRRSDNNPNYVFCYIDGEKVPVTDGLPRQALASTRKLSPEFQERIASDMRVFDTRELLNLDPAGYKKVLNTPGKFGAPCWQSSLSVPLGGKNNIGLFSNQPLRLDQHWRILNLIDLYRSLAPSAGSFDADESRPELLTSRERSCLNWAVKGKSIADISDILCISGPTVKSRLEKAKKKYKAKNNRQLIIQYAIDTDGSYL